MTADKRAMILGMMIEGTSIRSICRMSGASKNTVTKLLVEAGTAFAEYHLEWANGQSWFDKGPRSLESGGVHTRMA